MVKTKLTIDLAALAANYRSFRDLGSAEAAGVVKADGYGLGTQPVVETLLGQGCKTFFVARIDEGIAVRALTSDAAIIVFDGAPKGGEETLLEYDLIPAINSLEQLSRWRDFAAQKNKALPAFLHIDTGMNRLGLSAGETATLIADLSLLEPLDLHCVLSHFACADEKDHPMNEEQARCFASIAWHFPAARKSLSNSSGAFRNKDWHYDLLRPGIALYGGNPIPEKDNPMQPVVTLETPILQTRRVKKGESAGYGASHVFDKETQLATVPLGYADGFLRAGSNTAKLYWKGQPCPIRGRVSMDTIIVETGHLPSPPQTGDSLEVIGSHQSVDALAADLGTISYEVLTALGRRYHRDYHS